MESIIEVDEAVMERYFEGTPPTDEELPRLIVRAVAQGALIPIVCVSGKTGVGLPELLDALAVCAPPPDADRPHGRQRRRRAGRGQGRPRRAAGRPGLQDPHRPLRAEAQLHPHLLGHAEEGRDGCRSSGLRKGLKLAQLFDVQANETQPDRRRRARRHRGRDQDGRPADRHDAGRDDDAADPLPFADGRPGRHAPRAAATRPSSPAR